MNILASRLSETIGMTILHSLWQISLLWIVLVAVLRLWPKASSTVRYTLAIATLILCVLVTGTTAVYEWQSYSSIQEATGLSTEEVGTVEVIHYSVEQTLVSKAINVINTAAPMLTWLWCAGLVVMGVRFGGSFYYLSTLRSRQHVSDVPREWKTELKRLSTSLGLTRNVAIGTSERITTPLTLGSISPIILLPVGLLSGLSTKQIEAILVHELYHIKRQDYFVNICQAMVEVLLFYHPAIWHINNIIREERENCCDDKTVTFCGDAISYARALTQIQEINTSTKPSLAMSATGPNAGNFTNRIKRLFNIYPNPAQARSKGILALGSLIAYLCIVLASANVSTAQPSELQKSPVTTTVNELIPTKNNIDTIPAVKQVYILDGREVTPLQLKSVKGEDISSLDIQKVEIIDSMRTGTLDNCVKQVRLLLTTKSFKRADDNRYEFTVQDSLKIVNSIDRLSQRNITLHPTQILPRANRVNGTRVLLVDSARVGTDQTLFVKNLGEARPMFVIDGVRIDKNQSHLALKQVDPKTIESITIIKNQEAVDLYGDDGKDGVIIITLKAHAKFKELSPGVAVQVFPNSTSDDLNISFTPSWNGSHVKMVLIDSDGKIVKEVTDAKYDNVATELKVDVSGFKKGIYILQIVIDGVKSQQRVVVE